MFGMFTLASNELQPVVNTMGTFTQLKDSQVAVKCSVDRGGTPAHHTRVI